jgi:hypothetical protein
MQNQTQIPGAPDARLRASPSSSNVDIRCAITLVRVALQTLADLNLEAAAAIDNALGHEIEAARSHDDPDTLAVIDILSDVRARLSGEEAHVLGEDNAWYID